MNSKALQRTLLLYASSVIFSQCMHPILFILQYKVDSRQASWGRGHIKHTSAWGKGHIKHTNPYRAVEARSRIDAREPSIQDVYDVEGDCSGPRYRLGSKSRFEELDKLNVPITPTHPLEVASLRLDVTVGALK